MIREFLANACYAVLGVVIFVILVSLFMTEYEMGYR